jgi:predicted metal-dependent hydrolase
MKENELFKRGVGHFNARRFFEAHEVWEELWLHATEPDKTFLQGLIQVAAAFHHYGRGNLGGARSLLAPGIAKIGEAPSDHRTVALAELRDSAEEWAKALDEGKDPGRKRLPRIRWVGRTEKGLISKQVS